MTRTYTSTQAMHVSGASFRQLDHWCTHGIFGEERRNLGSGNRRPPYTTEDVIVMGALTRASSAFADIDRRGGLGIDLLRQIADLVREGDWDVTVQVSRHVELTISVGDLWASATSAKAASS